MTEGSDDSNFQMPPVKCGASTCGKAEMKKSKTQKHCDRYRKFQTVHMGHQAKVEEGIIASDGILHMVKCKVCSVIDRKPYIMAPKFDTL